MPTDLWPEEGLPEIGERSKSHLDIETPLNKAVQRHLLSCRGHSRRFIRAMLIEFCTEEMLIGTPSDVSPRPIKVFDFFSGCGGTSAGLREAGMDIVFGLDNDRDAASTFQANFPGAQFLQVDVTKLRADKLCQLVAEARPHPILFCGCAPCQPFSQQTAAKKRKKQRLQNDKRVPLLQHFGRFVRYHRPDFVLVENVPGLQKLSAKVGPFNAFIELLDKLGYNHVTSVVECCDYGVPQRRARLVLLASLRAGIQLPEKTHGPATGNPYSVVRDWIRNFPRINAGSTHPTVPNHRAASLSALNLKRIKATPPGETRNSWPAALRLACHKNGHTGHTDVYGRLRWKQPASALTTRCISLSNGRFGHPTQNRAISVREAASLQTFPPGFIFCGSLNSMARQIGNAVPVIFAQRMGEAFIKAQSA